MVNCSSIDDSSILPSRPAEIIVRTFKEFHGGLTTARLVGILTGKSESHAAKSISTYQSCLHYSAEQIEHNLHSILSKKIVKEINGKFFLDPIEELMDSETASNVKPDNYEHNLELFNKLREERNLAAKKFSQQAEIICSDKILRNIARNKPKTASELLNLEGFNQRMFNKIGAEILEVIKEYVVEHKVEQNISGLPKHISQTYKLVQKGYSLSEISNLLKLSESIVSVQIESIISYYPEDNYKSLIQSSEFEEIKKTIEDFGGNLKDVKERLPSSINYAKIRIVKALLSCSQSSSV